MAGCMVDVLRMFGLKKAAGMSSSLFVLERDV